MPRTNRIALVFKFFGISAFWGLILGGGFGAAIGTLLGVLSLSLGGLICALILFVPLGAISGVLLGGINGILIGIFTASFFYGTFDSLRYKITASLVAGALTFLGSFIWFWGVGSFYSATGTANAAFIFVLAMLATVAAVIASQRITQWYIAYAASNNSPPSN